MKTTSRSLYSKIAAIAVVLCFGLAAYAESPREELAHAYYLLKSANADYGGHRAKALHELGSAGEELHMELKGGVPEGERQWHSDKQLEEARRLIADVNERMEERDRQHISHHLEASMKEIDLALRKR